MSLEAVLPVDLLMDACILTAVQLALGRLHLRRLLRALLLLCFYSILSFFPGLGWLRSWVALSASCLIAAALLTGSLRPRRVLEAAFCMGVAAFVCGGCAAASGGGPGRYLPMAALGLLALVCVLRRRRHIRFRWDIELTLEKDGLRADFPALIDTGNRLREHRSGLPVLIVEARAMPRLAQLAQDLDPDELRHLPYGALGGSGELVCFLPDRVLFRSAAGAPVEAPPCWVAVYPGRIPGRVRALAPPEFAEAADCAADQSFIHHSVRRFCYAFLKRETIHLRPGRANPEGLGVLHRRQRSAPAAVDTRGGEQPRAQGTCGRPRGALHDDRAKSAPGGVHRPQI